MDVSFLGLQEIQTRDISSLPAEMLRHCFGFFTARDLCTRINRVCVKWQCICHDMEDFWRDLLKYALYYVCTACACLRVWLIALSVLCARCLHFMMSRIFECTIDIDYISRTHARMQVRAHSCKQARRHR